MRRKSSPVVLLLAVLATENVSNLVLCRLSISDLFVVTGELPGKEDDLRFLKTNTDLYHVLTYDLKDVTRP